MCIEVKVKFTVISSSHRCAEWGTKYSFRCNITAYTYLQLHHTAIEFSNIIDWMVLIYFITSSKSSSSCNLNNRFGLVLIQYNFHNNKKWKRRNIYLYIFIICVIMETPKTNGSKAHYFESMCHSYITTSLLIIYFIPDIQCRTHDNGTGTFFYK